MYSHDTYGDVWHVLGTPFNDQVENCSNDVPKLPKTGLFLRSFLCEEFGTFSGVRLSLTFFLSSHLYRERPLASFIDSSAAFEQLWSVVGWESNFL